MGTSGVKIGRAYYAMAMTGLSDLDRAAVVQEGQTVQRVCDDLGVNLFNPANITTVNYEITPEEIYSQTRRELRESDILILNCRYPSFGTGQVLEMAANFSIPVVLLVPNWLPISRLVRGSPTLRHEVRFESTRDLKADLAGVLGLAFKTAELQNESSETSLNGLVEAVSTINAELITYLKQHPEGLYIIEPRQFEELVAELLASFGWEVALTPKTNDGGYDIFAVAKNIAPGVNAAWIVECKRYARELKVGVEIVRALYGAKSSLDGVNAMLATTSYFTRGARQFKSSRYNLELRDYADVVEWLEAYSPNPNGTIHIRSQRGGDNAQLTCDESKRE